MSYMNLEGVLVVQAEDANWPNSANIFIFPDERGFSLLDIGCGGISGIEHLRAGLEYWKLKLQNLHTVILTHAHPDHMGALSWILEETRPELLIHPFEVEAALDPVNLEKTFDIQLAKNCWAASGRTDNLLGFDLLGFFKEFGCSMSAAGQVQELHEGRILELGSFNLEVFHTPGHSPGHVSLFDGSRRILFAGDLVGKGPAWYNPASGGFAAYLESLAKLEALDSVTILPSHGPLIEYPSAAIQKVREKLLGREVIVRKMLATGAKSFMEINEALFPNTLLHFFPGCGITQSHLSRLEEEGVIKREGNRIVLLK